MEFYIYCIEVSEAMMTWICSSNWVGKELVKNFGADRSWIKEYSEDVNKSKMDIREIKYGKWRE